MDRSCDSSPQSLTTTHEQLTTLRALPSRSIWPIKIVSTCLCRNFRNVVQKLTQTGPLAQLLSVWDLDQWDLVFRAKGNDELLVCLFFAGFVEDAHVCLAAIEGFGGLTETAGETVVDESGLEASLQSVEDGHLTFTGGGIARDFDFVRLCDGGCRLFSVRLLRLLVGSRKRWVGCCYVPL